VNAALRDLLVGIQLGWVEDDRPVRGRHTALTHSLVPVGGIWRRQPVLNLDDEWASTVPDPEAETRSGGWYLPDVPGDGRLVIPSTEGLRGRADDPRYVAAKSQLGAER
jgi:hypothetical protein